MPGQISILVKLVIFFESKESSQVGRQAALEFFWYKNKGKLYIFEQLKILNVKGIWFLLL
jgi:hypothetical protein